MNTIHYKNTDKSSFCFFEDKKNFILLTYKNTKEKKIHLKYILDKNYLQLYYSLEQDFSVDFNMEHYKLQIDTEKSGLFFFKQKPMNLLFSIPSGASLMTILIPIKNFHDLFANETNSFFNFENLNIGKPIIEQHPIKREVKLILHQIINKKIYNNLDKLYIKAKIYELLSIYFQKYQQENENPCPFMKNEQTIAQIKKAKDLIIENMINPPSLETISKNIGINLKKLKIYFKEYYGAPVYTFLLNYKLEQAKKLLEEKSLNVTEIATKIGYSNSSHFIAAFKKKFGITPKQFTKQ